MSKTLDSGHGLAALAKLADGQPHTVTNRNRGPYVAFPTAQALERLGFARMSLYRGGEDVSYYIVAITDKGRAELRAARTQLREGR